MTKKLKNHIGLILALISAFLCAFNIIIEKIYISTLPSEAILFQMYFGAGIGLFSIHVLTKKKSKKNNKITKNEIPKILIIVLCELFASLLIIEAVKNINASLVSLLSIFEIVATSICAYIVFKNPITKNEMIAIVLVIIGSIILNIKRDMFDSISLYSLLVIGACIFWGIENNITASISSKEPSFFTAIKCSSVALLYFLICIFKNDVVFMNFKLIILGFFSYGISILSYALSTKYLGASKATLVFSYSPILGVLLSFIIFKDYISPSFFISLIIMSASLVFIGKEESTKN